MKNIAGMLGRGIMMMMRLICVLALMLTALPESAKSATVNLTETINYQFYSSERDTRGMYFELTRDLTITELGILFDPSSSFDELLWTIYSVDDLGANPTLRYSATSNFLDSGYQVYNTAVNWAISAGHYLLAVGVTYVGDKNVNPRFGAYRTSGTPSYFTSDGIFRIWDAASGSHTDPYPSAPCCRNNTIVGISVTTSASAVSPIPLPPAFPLILVALAGLVWVGRETVRTPRQLRCADPCKWLRAILL